MVGSLPLVHLSVLRPLVSDLRARGIDPEVVLEASGLTLSAVSDDNAKMHVIVIHQFLEIAAKFAEDPTFAATAGLRLDTSGWSFLSAAEERANSLGDFLTGYVSGANQVNSSVAAYLEVRDALAVFGERRRFKPSVKPAQNDGYMIALAISILRRAIGRRLEPKQVTLIMSDTKVVPRELDDFQLLKGDWMGSRVSFPSEWLSYPVESPSFDKEMQRAASAKKPEIDFLEGFRGLLLQNVDKQKLNSRTAADLVAMPVRKLARRLGVLGTDISSELGRAKMLYSKEQLQSTDRSIEEVSAAIGYTDPANFSRAFRRETGLSPTSYRKTVNSK